MPRVVNISEAKAQLSALVAQVRTGETVLITKAGTPVAVLSAYEASCEPRALGGWEDQVSTPTTSTSRFPTSYSDTSMLAKRDLLA